MPRDRYPLLKRFFSRFTTPAMTSIHYLTKNGLAKLQAELDELKERRKHITKRIEEAIKMGDLSENAEYTDAKEEQGFVEGRISEVEQILKNSQIIEQTNKTKDEVVIGSSVHADCDGIERVFFIVGPEEANPGQGYISHESPIGKALMGRKRGEEFDVETPGGVMKCKIMKIS